MNAYELGFVVASEALKVSGKRDVSDLLQKLIDENPNRTIYLPDGRYVLSKPVLTPAHPERSVSLKLSKYAVIQASDDWNSGEALIRLAQRILPTISERTEAIIRLRAVYSTDAALPAAYPSTAGARR